MMFVSLLATLAPLLTAAPTGQAGPITWVHDDWQAASAQASREGKTVAVDVWATWCHTCLSMTNYVFTDPDMAEVKDRHVWLALNYDLEVNAPYFERHPATAFPTFLIMDPKSEKVLARWAGSGTAKEMVRFFSHTISKDDALTRGHRALAEKRFKQARDIFEAALKTPLPANTKTRMLLGWIETLYDMDKVACATQGSERISDTNRSAQGADFAILIAYCAEELKTPTAKKKVLRKVIAKLASMAADKSTPISVDDRSGIYGVLQSSYETLGHKTKARAALNARIALLEGAAKTAKTPAARATFDYHRMQAYLQLRRSADALKMLSASEKAQPTDFNHPWRQAKVHLHDKAYGKAVAAIDRALARGYGGRKLRLFSTKIEILLAAGKTKAALAVVKVARAQLSKMNEAQVRPYWRQEFESRAKQAKGQDS